MNSLRGHHEVDFTAAPLNGCGLFAITGATGAGKSTLLDAITLALFGRAARYESESNPVDMMSRHTGQCQAEVLFQTRAGTYRAEWLMHRSRKSPNGAPQPPRRHVYDANETPLNRTATECQQQIEDLIGLDYQRFLRSVLLAQGEFARFLKADANARAELLESLTGTEIYSELGRLAHSHTVAKERACDEWRNSMATLPMLTEEERADSLKVIAATSESIQHNSHQLEILRQQLARNQALHSAAAELTKIHSRCAAWQQQDESFLARRTTLLHHQKALSAQPTILRWRDATARHTDASREAQSAQQNFVHQLNAWEKSVSQSRTYAAEKLCDIEILIQSSLANIATCRSLQTSNCNWVDQHSHLAPLPKALPDLLQQHQESLAHKHLVQLHSRDITKLQAELQNSLSTADSLRVSIQHWQKELHSAQCQRDAILAKIATHRLSENESPNEILARIRNQENSCIQALRTLDDIAAATRELDSLLAAASLAASSIDDLSARFSAAQQERLLREDHFLLAKSAASLEQQRLQLSDGKPCPLCGSLHHPWRVDGSTSPALTLVESAYRQAQQHWEELQSQLQQQQSLATSRSERITALRHSIQDWQNSMPHQHSRDQWEMEKSSCIDLTAAIMALVAALAEAQQHCADALLRLQQASAALTDNQQRHDKLLQRIHELESHCQTLQTQIRTSTSHLHPRLDALLLPHDNPDEWKNLALLYQKNIAHTQELKLEQAQLEQKLHREQALVLELQDLIEPWKNLPNTAHIAPPTTWKSPADAKQTTTAAHEQKKTAEQQAQWTAATAQRCHLELTQSFRQLEDQAIALGFANGDQLSAALIPAEQAAQWISELEIHDTQGTRWKTMLHEAEQRHAQLIEKRGNDPTSSDELQANLQAHTRLHDQSLQEQILAKDRLARDAATRLNLRDKAETLATMERDLSHWQIMKDLIGSHDGAKFRRHAQSLSLAQLLLFANRHMQQLNPRYAMKRSSDGELNLEIIDHHQGNTCRPMNSLSGGESFLASLALALALSDIAGQNQSIETLFIDEGFGTLDSDTLDTAISTLEAMQQRGKTIGVISHIETLKERIRVQIHVEKKSSGQSAIRIIS